MDLMNTDCSMESLPETSVCICHVSLIKLWSTVVRLVSMPDCAE